MIKSITRQLLLSKEGIEVDTTTTNTRFERIGFRVIVIREDRDELQTMNDEYQMMLALQNSRDPYDVWNENQIISRNL